VAKYRVYLLDENHCAREASNVYATSDAEAIELARQMIPPGGKVGFWGEPQSDIVISDRGEHPRPLVAAVVRRSTDM
jgi:hypothetical protein